VDARRRQKGLGEDVTDGAAARLVVAAREGRAREERAREKGGRNRTEMSLRGEVGCQ
jgi:hypothetical protein